MKATSKVTANSIKNTGCPANSIIVGVKPQCKGVKIKVLEAISPQAINISLPSSFEIITSGDSTSLYSPIYEKLLGKQFANSDEALREMNEWRDKLKIQVSEIKFAFAVGKYEIEKMDTTQSPK